MSICVARAVSIRDRDFCCRVQNLKRFIFHFHRFLYLCFSIPICVTQWPALERRVTQRWSFLRKLPAHTSPDNEYSRLFEKKCLFVMSSTLSYLLLSKQQFFYSLSLCEGRSCQCNESMRWTSATSGNRLILQAEMRNSRFWNKNRKQTKGLPANFSQNKDWKTDVTSCVQRELTACLALAGLLQSYLSLSAVQSDDI